MPLVYRKKVEYFPTYRRLEPTLKKSRTANDPSVVARICGLIEPKQQGHQASLSVAESMLAHDTWRGGVWTLSKLKCRYFTNWTDKRVSTCICSYAITLNSD